MERVGGGGGSWGWNWLFLDLALWLHFVHVFAGPQCEGGLQASSNSLQRVVQHSECLFPPLGEGGL